MNTLTLRIYLSIVAVLLLFATGAGWLFQREMAQERSRVQSALDERTEAWGDLIQRSLPGTDAPRGEQAAALADWSQRLRIPLALDANDGTRIGASESFEQSLVEGRRHRVAVQLDDGRTLWVLRRGPPRERGEARDGPRRGQPPPVLSLMPRGMQSGVGLAAVLVLLFVAVAAGAWPVARGLTRRLKALQQGVEAFGAGRLDHRVAVSGRDEVAAVAVSFNQAAARVEALVRSHQSLLANASHELRSPLARMKMAVSMLDSAPPAQRERLRREIDTNVAELDALVEEVLLASRLDAQQALDQNERVDLLGLAAEEAARVNAQADGVALAVTGDERLLRRALRNLLENARRYGGDEVTALIERRGGDVLVRVCDRGPGVPEAQRERIFEPFYRLPGHAETAGGVGLGLSLVRQIAERHGGSVRCLPREGGGTCFELRFPSAGG